MILPNPLRRLQTVSRLFRMILDVTSPAFVVEDRQWQPNVIDIFFYFFSALWTDDRVRHPHAEHSILVAFLSGIFRRKSGWLLKRGHRPSFRLISMLSPLAGILHWKRPLSRRGSDL